MQQAFEYIKYYFVAKGRHGIHSPFVYELVDQCLNTPVDPTDQKVIESIIRSINSNETKLEISDFGAGSRNLGNTRTPRQMYRNSASKGKYGRLLYQLARHYQFRHMLELGTSLGIGSLHLKLGSQAGVLTTVEGCPETFKLAKEHVKQCGMEINCILSKFDDFFGKLPPSACFDFVYVDGHHDGKALLHYIELLDRHIHNDTLILIDDIRWSDSMFTAWNKLIANSDLKLSIDFFRMGLIAKRKQQEKEHFVLKLRR